MGQQIRFESNERVDLPDALSLGTVQQSEFRHILSALVGSDILRVIRGFEVQPESPVSSRVLIKMDRTADAIPGIKESLAYGAENLGGGTIDFGVLTGGRNSANELEGPAQLLLDFAAQAPATYTVEMRYATTDGVNENRAFWNPGANTEFVAPVNTRFLPTWQARFSGSPSPEWIPLASVVWNGVTISASDITDIRNLAHEGATASGFQFTLQALATVAGHDFNRSITRAVFGTGVSGVLQHLLALNRQVLDLKGQSTTGKFDWFSRTFTPPPNDDLLWVERTKTLRSIDTISFSVADGVTDWGDFNGVASITECLNFIATHAAALPRKIKIIIKNRPTAAGVSQLFLAGPISIPNKDLVIEGAMGHGDSTFNALHPWSARGQAKLIWTSPVGGTVLTLSGRSSLVMRDIAIHPFLFTDAHVLSVEGPVNFIRTTIEGYNEGLTRYALRCHSDGSVMVDSHLIGNAQFGGGNYLAHPIGGSVINTIFTGVVKLRLDDATSGLSIFDVLARSAQNTRFEGCTFQGRTPLTIGGAVPPNPFGAVDARGIQSSEFINCGFNHSSEEDGLRLGGLPALGGVFLVAANVRLHHCAYAMYADNTHLFLLGIGGLFGTGHHIFSQAPTVLDSFGMVNRLHIEDCSFFGTPNGSVDASAVFGEDIRHLWVSRCAFRDYFDLPAFGAQTMILVTGVSTGSQDIHIEHNTFSDWQQDVSNLSCVVLSSVQRAWIKNNDFNRFKRDALGTFLPTSGTAIAVQNVFDVWIDQNLFTAWRDSASPLTQLSQSIRLQGFCRHLQVNNNIFDRCGGENIQSVVGAGVMEDIHIQDNQFLVGSDDTKFFAAIALFNGSTEQLMITGNNWNYPFGGVVKECVHLGSGLDVIFVGNHFNKGNIRNSTLGGGTNANTIGYADAAAVTNRVNAYV